MVMLELFERIYNLVIKWKGSTGHSSHNSRYKIDLKKGEYFRLEVIKQEDEDET